MLTPLGHALSPACVAINTVPPDPQHAMTGIAPLANHGDFVPGEIMAGVTDAFEAVPQPLSSSWGMSPLTLPQKGKMKTAMSFNL